MSTVKLNLYNKEGEIKGEIKLAKGIFDVAENIDLIHQAAVAQMGNERQVLAHTKSRSEVRGGGRKPWKQKGTGRARAGSTRSPIWIGGGITFGPTKDRNFSKDINKKMRQKAMFMVLSDKVRNDGLVVIEEIDLKEYKTKEFDTILKNLETKVLNKNIKKEKESASAEALADKGKTDEKIKKVNKTPKRSVLFVDYSKNDKVKSSARNLQGVKVINLENINILDLLKYKSVIFIDKSIEKLEDIYKK